jgi:hypothetical protein
LAEAAEQAGRDERKAEQQRQPKVACVE